MGLPHDLVDGRDRCWIVCTMLGIDQKSLPSVESNGLHGLRQTTRRLAQIGMSFRESGTRCGGSQLSGNGIIPRAPKEPFGKVCLIERAAINPRSHDLR